MDLTKAEIEAVSLIADHLNGWSFAWHNKVRTYGSCNYDTKTIYLSRKTTVGRADKEVINTILHEIAHALTPGQHHNAIWRAKHIELGGDGKRLASDKSNVPYKWVMVLGDEVIRGWYRRPNKSTFDKLSTTYLKRDKEGTIGKLKIIPCSV